jgi:hypothetical protein
MGRPSKTTCDCICVCTSETLGSKAETGARPVGQRGVLQQKLIKLGQRTNKADARVTHFMDVKPSTFSPSPSPWWLEQLLLQLGYLCLHALPCSRQFRCVCLRSGLELSGM